MCTTVSVNVASHRKCLPITALVDLVVNVFLNHVNHRWTTCRQMCLKIMWTWICNKLWWPCINKLWLRYEDTQQKNAQTDLWKQGWLGSICQSKT